MASAAPCKLGFLLGWRPQNRRLLTAAAAAVSPSAASAAAAKRALRHFSSDHHASSPATAGLAQERRAVDMVSDTVTKPCKAMLSAMLSADVGDDVRGEDPTVNALQERVAAMFGKEAALFVPTGTMGNLVAVLTHCRERSSEVLLGNRSHIYLYEQGGCAQLGGVHSTALRNKRDGTFDLAELHDSVHGADRQHEADTRLVCIENTHNYCGGTVLPLGFMQQVYEAAKHRGLQVHLDGARIMNACVASGGKLEPKAIGRCVDSLNMCFSKGLGAPAGSILVGSRAFVESARRTRKAVGGGMRQSGLLAAAAAYALDNNVAKLSRDHDNARSLAQTITSFGSELISIDMATVQTNIVMVDFPHPAKLNAVQFTERMQEVTEKELAALGQGIAVRMASFHGMVKARFVTHLDLSNDDIQAAKAKFSYVMKEYTSAAQ